MLPLSNLRFLRTVTRTLLRQRNTRLVQEIVRLVPRLLPQQHVNHFLSEVTTSLGRLGAHRLATRLSEQSSWSQFGRGGRSLRFLTARAIGFRLLQPTPQDVGKVLAIYRQNRNLLSLQHKRAPSPSDFHPSGSRLTGADITHVVSILVNSKDIRAARKLLSRENSKIDDKTRTSICNTMLNGMLKMHDRLSGRKVRHVLNTRTILTKEYGFRPDHVTLNIQVKTLLMWKSVFTTERVKALFNMLMRDRDWVQQRWRQYNGHPFDSGSNPISATHRGSGYAVPRDRSGVVMKSESWVRWNGVTHANNQSPTSHLKHSHSASAHHRHCLPTSIYSPPNLNTPAADNTASPTSLALPGGIGLPAVPKHCSFRKHVRPLYKMFIKAFYQRGDADAARTVVGILKYEEAVQAKEQEKRDNARRLGRLKKAKKVAAGSREL